MIFNKYKILEKNIGYRFRKKSLLEAALCHPSHAHENASEINNQRLEFLGDAVLGMICASSLYQRFPHWPEGAMTQTRSRLTNTQSLSQIASTIGLGEFLLLGKGESSSGGRKRESNLEDALEAVIGAAYLDGGMKAAEKIYDHLFLSLENLSEDETSLINPKGSLQEICQQRWNENPQYRIIEEAGPSHNRRFIAEAYTEQETLGTGAGSSKRNAEIAAAKNALENLQR